MVEARGRWIALFDNDQLAEKDWLKNLLAVALQIGADCIAGTRLLDLPIEQPSPLGPICRRLLGESIYHEAPAIYRGKEGPGIGNLLIALGIFDSFGPFDTSMLWNVEDSDTLLRARAAGSNIWIAPDAVVRHVVPSTLHNQLFGSKAG